MLLLLTDSIQLLLEGETSQFVEGEAGEQVNASGQHEKGVTKGSALDFLRTHNGSRIGHAPMGSHWLTRP